MTKSNQLGPLKDVKVVVKVGPVKKVGPATIGPARRVPKASPTASPKHNFNW